MALTFKQRLEAAKDTGNLRDADLARWFDRRHSTVRGWLEGRTPSGPAGDIRDLFATLVVLEQRIVCGELPMPNRVSSSRRISYLQKLKTKRRRKVA